MTKYIECEKVIEAFDDPTVERHYGDVCPESVIRVIEQIPAADVLPRDEAIKMGAELAAMHGSDATSQQLEEAYLEGVEYGMTRRDVRPVVQGRWVEFKADMPLRRNECSECGYITNPWLAHVYNFCPNCGADMRESLKEEK